MAIDVNSCAQTGSSLFYAGKQHLDPKASVATAAELESLRPYLPPYSLVISEDDGTLWQMQPNAEDGWIEFSSGSGAAINDTTISTDEVYSSSKVDTTYAKISNVYDKTTADTTFGSLTQQTTNTTDITTLKTKVNSLSSAIIYKGNVPTYGALLLIDSPDVGGMWIVDSDETKEGASTTYIYSSENKFVFNGIREIKNRDFETEPIVLGEEQTLDDGSTKWFTEVKGKLKLSSIDLTGIGASDVEYTNGAYPTIATVEDALNELLYAPLTITFTTTAAKILEKGATLVAPIFNWVYNKKVVSQSIDGDAITDLDARIYTYPSNITTNKTVTLTANDGKSNFVARITFNFYDAILYGSSATGTYDNAFVNALSSKALKANAKGSYTINCASGEYIFFAIPTAYSNGITFWSGGFSGGVSKVATLTVENSYGVQCNYSLFKSDNHSLGNSTIEIK